MSMKPVLDVFLVVVVVLIVTGCIFVIALCNKRRRKTNVNNFTINNDVDEELLAISLAISLNSYTYEELAKATDEFSNNNLLGKGGFGLVYKGVLPNGEPVAIKKLKYGSSQGKREFLTEVQVINQVHQKNLITLLGYCIQDNHHMLVYEFVENETLEHHLHGKDIPILDWSKRMKIALGCAKGLTYLHELCQPQIIHRDIKTANILLDKNFEAKIADFGLAKSLSDSNFDDVTRVMGTHGYIDPKYVASEKVTEKTDVYAFGVVVLELITGRKPIAIDESSKDGVLVDWARPLLDQALENGNLNNLVDPRLGTNYNREQMIKMIACARSCVHTSPKCRARMSKIFRVLEEHISLYDLNVGSTFGEYNSEDLKKIMELPLLETRQEQDDSEYYTGPNSELVQHLCASQEQGSGEYYSGLSCEDGQHPCASQRAKL